MKELNWGILGIGNIADEFAQNMIKMHPIYGAASRDASRAKAFGEKYSVTKIYDSYEDMLADPAVDIIYIAVVNSQHYKWIIRSLECGKHVLCEKAMLSDHKECLAAYALAREKGLILAEAMTIYHMPLYKEIKQQIEGGRIGKLKFAEADFGSLKDDDPKNRFFNPDLGGGAMLDIGTYALSFIMYFLEGELTEVKSLMNPYPTGVDEMWSISLKTDMSELAGVNLAFRTKLPKRGVIAGDKAYISVMEYPRAHLASLVYPDGREELLDVGDTDKAMQYEISDMEKAVRTGDPSFACTDCTMKVIKLMDGLLSGKY